ncbi:MAG: AMP-binding protein [Muribaculaceae bacterium]|nr:AMP-binding protein [Muribaculaceae bacterium]
MKNQDNVNGYIRQAIVDCKEHSALTDFQGVTYQFGDVARKIAKLHILFERAGLKKGDKVALCGRNSAQWAVGLLASLTYGTVAVPILHEFKPDNIHHLVAHSDARLLFTDEHTWENLDTAQMPELEGVVLLKDYSLLFSRNKKLTEAREKLNLLFGERYPERFRPEMQTFHEPAADELALINYTSGSTGFSKGVMLTYGNLWSNLQFCIDGLTFLKPGDPMISMLPLAHMYGLMVELLHPFVKGCHIYFLTRTPSPKVILGAFAEVKPKLIVAVPLILEKIVKTRIFPELEKPVMKVLLHLPYIDEKVYAKVRGKMLAAFGGNLLEMIIGGAGLNKDVEAFLRRIRFPYTVGYGMTECGPLIAYAPWDIQRPGACGKAVDRMAFRIESADPEHTPGVLKVRGANVMKGYYKNEEATAQVMDGDGWMNTGDICQCDPDGFLYIRGRDKNMILGPSGQNIYPEEIEQQLNNLPYVGESVVVSRDGKLVGLVYPDMEAVSREHIGEEQLREIMNQNLKALNATQPAYSQVSELKIHHEEFEKTPKRSIKRYLYS